MSTVKMTPELAAVLASQFCQPCGRVVASPCTSVDAARKCSEMDVNLQIGRRRGMEGEFFRCQYEGVNFKFTPLTEEQLIPLLKKPA